MSRKAIDMIGKKVGRLTVLCRNGTNKSGNIRWKCLCDCGKETTVTGHYLRNKNIQSCGCLQRELSSKRLTKQNKGNSIHNKTNTRIYRIWANMKARCYNENSKNYSYYGLRGITVCNEWENDFQSFYNWSMENGYKDNLTIDRVDNDGNYEPNNCRWATRIEQANNKRSSIRVKYMELDLTIAEWSKITKINRYTLYDRYEKGLTGSELFVGGEKEILEYLEG